MNLTLRMGLAQLAFAFSLSAGLAAPVVTLAPAAAPPTANLKVSGKGFGASKLIDIYFDTVDYCLAVSTGTGAVSCTIKVPKDAQPQQHWVTVVERFSGTAAQRSFTVRTDWAQFHGRNAAHSGVNPFENTLNVNNVANLDTLWTAPIGALGTYGSPAVAGGKVYIGGRDGKLYAFDSLSGATIAGIPKILGGSIQYSTPAVGYGNVYIGTADGDHQLYAFRAANGGPVAGFPKPLTAGTNSSPALALGNVYIGTQDHILYAYNATTGAQLGGFPRLLGGEVTASPTIANGHVYAGAAGVGGLYAFDALTGANVGLGFWDLGTVVNSATVAGGNVYAVSDAGSVYAFDDAFGPPLPGFPINLGSNTYSSPTVAGGLILIGAEDGKLRAYKFPNLAWTTTPLDTAIHAAPIVANGVVYVNSLTRLYALSLATGQILWSTGILTNGYTSPVVADGIVYLGSTNGNLYAFSVNGQPPAARRPGGALGVVPAVSSLKPDYSLKPVRN